MSSRRTTALQAVGLSAVLTAVAAWPQTARAGNFPPVADGSASPAEVLQGEVVSFSSDASFDPDDGPNPLTFTWDFGDGTQSTDPNPTHTYADLGVHIVTLTVSDGVAQSLVTLAVVTLSPPTPVRPRKSGPIALSSDDTLLVVANPDSDSITFVDTGDLSTVEVDVCDEPHNLAWTPDDAEVLVSCFGSDEVWAVDTGGDLIASAPTGRQPFGLVSRPDGSVLVANYGAGTVGLFDASLSAETTIEVQAGPRAIAISGDGTSAFVTHFLTTGASATVTRLDLSSDDVAAEIPLAEDPGPDTASSGRGVPNLLAAVAIDPAGQTVWTGAIKANTGRGPALDGQDLHPRNRLRGVFAPISMAEGLENLELRIDTNDADSVSAIAFSPRGRFAYLTHQGAARLSVYDIPTAALVDTSDGTAVNIESRVDTGAAPQGIVVSSDGSVAYVANILSRSISVFDASDPRAPTLRDTVQVTEEPLDPQVAWGKQLFFASREPIHSDQNYIACASCHPDGGQDGRVWDFTQFGEGLRNTIDLRGRSGTGHGPVHWTANFDEIQDFENDIVGGFGGSGLLRSGSPHAPLDDPNAGRSDALDALALYVSSLQTFPESPHRAADGELTAAALRGKDIFFREDTRCAECHAPPRFTDSELTDDPADFVRHDVGTRGPGSGSALGGELIGFDTPTLLGVWATAPYLHDGSASTLHDVLARNENDEHGVTSQLAADEIDDLVAYLLSLEGDEDEYPPLPPEPTSTGGESSGSSDDGGTSGEPATDTTDAETTAPAPTTAPTTETSDTDAPEADDGNGDGCGCSMPAPSRGGFLLMLAALLRRRKRRPCTH